jgi:hypothetical protein
MRYRSSLFAAIAVTVSLATQLPALAARPDTRAMTCEQARAFVRQQGAVVMSTGPYTYDRIVSGYGYCERGQETWLTTAPTRDNPKCRIGYLCKDRINDFHDHFPIWRQR